MSLFDISVDLKFMPQMYKQSPTYPFDIGQNQRQTTEAKTKLEHYKDTK